jgi:hypothetical protein
VQVCSEDEVLTLIHEGSLINHMKGNTTVARTEAGLSPEATRADALLSDVWTRKAEQVSRELYKRIEGGLCGCVLSRV